MLAKAVKNNVHLHAVVW